jgi:hypothetical protein
MGFSKKRLTAIQTNFGSAHFRRTWSGWPPRPPRGFEGAQPLQPGVGRRQVQVLGPAPRAPAPARSPARASRPRPALRPRRWARPEARALASRTVPRGRRGAPSSPRYGPSKAGHATRKPGHATRKRPTPPVFARPGPPPAGPRRPRRPRPPAALLCPLPRARGPRGRGTGGGFPDADDLGAKPKSKCTPLGCRSPAQPRPGRSPGRLQAVQRPQAASDPPGVCPALRRPRHALRRPVGSPPRRDRAAGHATRKPGRRQTNTHIHGMGFHAT